MTNKAKSPDEPIEKIAEEIIENAAVEEIYEEPMSNMQQVSIHLSSKTNYVYKEDEKKWEPFFQASKFDSKGYHREELIIDPPASFDGSEGTYQVKFDNDNKVFVLKIAPNPILSDAHSINSYKADQYGIITSDDSARHQAFTKSAKSIANKWYTFRYTLPWPGKPSEDLGLMPWLDFTEIEQDGRFFPVLVVNLSSIKPIEVEVNRVCGRLNKKKFTSPAKVKGVHMASDPNAQMAAMLESMFTAGYSLTPEMKFQAQQAGIDPEVIRSRMDTGDDFSSKRSRTE